MYALLLFVFVSYVIQELYYTHTRYANGIYYACVPYIPLSGSQGAYGTFANKFIEMLGLETRVLGLFCVEREPEACHRSLAAKKIATDLKSRVENVKS